MRYLSSDERLVLVVRRHYIVLTGPILVTVVVLIAGGFIGYTVSPGEGADLLDRLLGYLSIFFVLRLGYKVLEWWEDKIVVTDQRIVEVSGILTRRVASMPLVKVTDMTYRRTLAGRVCGYGDLILESAGQDQALSTIDYIPSPDEFYRTVTSLVTSKSAAVAPAPIPPPEESAEPGDLDDTGPLPRVIV